jgi:hypothetical protein
VTSLLIVSLLLNIVVLVPVTASLLARARWAVPAWGERTPARDILLSIYLSILFASSVLLVLVAGDGGSTQERSAAIALLTVQIVYKVLTTFTVHGALRNPVVLSNLAIGVVHGVTVATILPALV